MTWDLEAKEYLINQQYSKLVVFYEHKIEQNSENIRYYSYLGLAYLLHGDEEKAQTAWFFVLTQDEEKYCNELVNLLQAEAQRQELNQNYQTAYLICRQLQEIDSELVNNILCLINLEIILQIFKAENLKKYNLEKLIKHNLTGTINRDLLWNVLPKIVLSIREKALAITEASLNHITNLDTCVSKLDNIARLFDHKNPSFAIKLTQICLQLKPDNLVLLRNLFCYYSNGDFYQQAREIADRIYQKADGIALQVYGNYLLLDVLLAGGCWQEIGAIADRHKKLIARAIEANECPTLIDTRAISVIRPLFSLEDRPAENRNLQNQLARVFQAKTREVYGNLRWDSLKEKKIDNKHELRIGYIASTFRENAVGWLSRWLFKYHNRQEFAIFLYLIGPLEDRMTREWFAHNADCYRNLEAQPDKIAATIRDDNIDILLDLDSLTHDLICQSMSLKPVPMQITWLGLDATGIPAIDYFIVDPHVLPDNAQEYYQEKIWRLPHTYIAVDGYEVGIPTLRREDLEIPREAIIYLSIQTGWKRNQDNLRLQMEVLRQVNHSYFIIQGNPNQAQIREIAREEGYNPDKIRFLPLSAPETYRANLRIADVVLDSYPFNGATTTLDILWMEIPLVTKVGQQFHARQGYTFLTNLGISEGIAGSDAEYIEWGVKLGTDENLRQQVVWKLRQSKRTSPLWNGRQFTREMEQAYRQMWDKYINQQ